MKKIVLIYGALAGAIVGAMLLITMPLYEAGTLNIENGQLLGYSTMVIALSLIFFGIKSYRDNHLAGKITFWKALQIGLLITLVGSFIYAAAWEISYRNMSRDYISKMEMRYQDKLKAQGATEKELREAKEQFVMYDQNVLLRFTITAMVEMFPVGLTISLICAGLLRRKEFVPAA